MDRPHTHAPDAPDVLDVLIVGAGPTGLLLALWLRRLGRRVRIVDKAAEPGTTSRALAVQARTLEQYRQLGVADPIVARGLKFAAVNLWAGGVQRGHVVLGDLGGELSPFPYVTTYPQDEHERLLIDLLGREGVTVERPVELVGFVQETGSVRAELRLPDGATSPVTARYIAGCDGAHSAVRAALGEGFVGGTYDHLFYVADVRAHGPMMNGELHVALDSEDLIAVFPLADVDAAGGAGSRQVGRARLIGTMPAAVEAEAGSRALGWDDVSPDLLRRLHIDVAEVRWFSTYRVHHRVASQFRRGRAFLLGDAAHVHSPVGGQGMNTGLGDAVNLAWKLAAVLDGRADEALLDTYEPERIAFARRLVATTDRAFTAATSPTRWSRFVRLTLLPAAGPSAVSLRAHAPADVPHGGADRDPLPAERDQRGPRGRCARRRPAALAPPRRGFGARRRQPRPFGGARLAGACVRAGARPAARGVCAARAAAARIRAAGIAPASRGPASRCALPGAPRRLRRLGRSRRRSGTPGGVPGSARPAHAPAEMKSSSDPCDRRQRPTWTLRSSAIFRRIAPRLSTSDRFIARTRGSDRRVSGR